MSKKKAPPLNTVNPLGVEVPPLVEDVCSYLEHNALTAVGLFREAGSLSETLTLKRKFSAAKSKVQLSSYSNHSIASLLSHYLLDLEPPLLTYSLYDAWIGCMAVEPEELQIQCIQRVLYLLPPGRTCVLQRVIRLLVAVADHHKINKMSSRDLAVTLGSCLLHPEEQTPVSQYEEAASVHALVETLICQYDRIFLHPIMHRPKPPPGMPPALQEVMSTAREVSKADLGPKGCVSSRLRKELAAWMTALPRLAAKEVAKKAYAAVPAKEAHVVKIQALWRGYAVRKQLEDVNRAYQAAYNHATDELLRSQRLFIWTVSKAVREFESKLKLVRYSKLSKLSGTQPTPSKRKDSADVAFSELDGVSERDAEQDLRNAEAEVMAIIVNLNALLEVHSMQVATISARRDATWPLVVRVGSALEECVSLFIVYSAYIDMYTRVQSLTSTVLRLPERSPALQDYLAMEAGSYGFNRTLGQLIDMPFEHGIAGWRPVEQIVRVVLLHGEDPADTVRLLRTYSALQRVDRYFSGMLSWVSTERLIETETVLLGAPFSLSARKRRLIREGSAQIASESRYLFLFNDICVVAKKNTARDLGAVFRYQYHIDLDGCIVEDSSAERDAFTIRTEERAYQVSLRSQEAKLPWLADFQRAATNWNRTVFGLPLAICVQRHGQHEGVPVLVSNITRHLIAQGDTSSEVICAPENCEEMRTLKSNIEKTKKLQKLRFSRYSTNAVVHALKCFLGELPAPLLAVELCQEFPLFEDKASKKPDIDAMQELVQTLPEGRRALLHHVIRFLALCDADKAMVAAGWSGCIVRRRKQKLDSLIAAQPGEAILYALLTNYALVFDQKRELSITRRRKRSEPSVIELRKGNRSPRNKVQKKKNVAKRLMRSASSTLLSNRM
mmetsp:Transcript_12387/g.49648  ORF Transcript_12387/g.49648 Transcript_12387/m.49648 type:complete len:897 (+) Transcript_12387:79-2769(+)